MSAKSNKSPKLKNYSIFMYMNELGSRVVARSGIPSDIYHMGKLILQGFKEIPERVLLIDGAVNKSVTNKVVLERSVRCAEALKSLGLKCGDVMMLTAPNHLDVAVAMYGAIFCGVIVAPVDLNMKVPELQRSLTTNKPKIIFCQSEKLPEINEALKKCSMDIPVVTFDQGGEQTFKELLGNGSVSVDDFKVADLDPEESIMFLTSTSGTTGLPKSVALTHKNMFVGLPHFFSRFTNFPTPCDVCLMVSPVQWLSGILHYILPPILGYTRLQSSASTDVDHISDLITKYKVVVIEKLSPIALDGISLGIRLDLLSVCTDFRYLGSLFQNNSEIDENVSNRMSAAVQFCKHISKFDAESAPTTTMMSSNFMAILLNQPNLCDFSSVEDIFIGGSVVYPSTLEKLKKLVPHADIETVYGLSECTGLAVDWDATAPAGSIGKPIVSQLHRLVDVATQKDIDEPFVTGELWIKGPAVFKGYYNDPEATKEAITEDGWLKTGDLLYRNENYFYFYVERMKIMLKYKGHQISPLEIEMVIRRHPGVADVAVVGIPDEECGDLLVACVVRHEGSTVTAQEIKDIVEENLADPKKLRGGVVFMDMLPMGTTTKCDRVKLKNMVAQMERQ